MTITRLEEKMARIMANPSGASDFIICDAKDSDMGFGVGHAGPLYDKNGRNTGRFKGREAFLDQIRAIVEQDIVDLMLLSVGNMERLVVEEQIFSGSRMATAIRANDTTDVWALRHAAYGDAASLSFRTAEMKDYVSNSVVRRADIGLYSITFSNDSALDRSTLEAFRDFRREAIASEFPYFLEVFNPNISNGLQEEEIPAFVNDCIIRCLAGISAKARPRFLKVVYNGPRALEELVNYDPRLIVGVLGGSSGTTLDCLTLLHDAHKYGARVALFGRKINLAEDPLGIIMQMRHVADGNISPEEGVKAYHDGLAKQGLRPLRSLEDDSMLTDPILKR